MPQKWIYNLKRFCFGLVLEFAQAGTSLYQILKMDDFTNNKRLICEHAGLIIIFDTGVQM